MASIRSSSRKSNGRRPRLSLSEKADIENQVKQRQQLPLDQMENSDDADALDYLRQVKRQRETVCKDTVAVKTTSKKVIEPPHWLKPGVFTGAFVTAAIDTGEFSKFVMCEFLKLREKTQNGFIESEGTEDTIVFGLSDTLPSPEVYTEKAMGIDSWKSAFSNLPNEDQLVEIDNVAALYGLSCLISAKISNLNIALWSYALLSRVELPLLDSGHSDIQKVRTKLLQLRAKEPDQWIKENLLLGVTVIKEYFGI